MSSTATPQSPMAAQMQTNTDVFEMINIDGIDYDKKAMYSKWIHEDLSKVLYTGYWNPPSLPF